MTEVRYQFWDAIEPGSGETWAVRIEGGVVTGASGPLSYTEIVAADLPSMEYDDQGCLDDAAWIQADRDNWRLHETDVARDRRCTRPTPSVRKTPRAHSARRDSHRRRQQNGIAWMQDNYRRPR